MCIYGSTVIKSVFPSKCLHRNSQTKTIQVLYSTLCQTFQIVCKPVSQILSFFFPPQVIMNCSLDYVSTFKQQLKGQDDFAS